MTAVITAPWSNPELLIVGYTVWNVDGPRPDNPGGSVAAYTGGCESGILPLTVSVGAPLVESGLEANDPGTYTVEAWFVGYCDQPSFDVVDTARAAYPVERGTDAARRESPPERLPGRLPPSRRPRGDGRSPAL